jgi:hypothetical protein
MKKLIACVAALMIGAPGYAQASRVTISDKATYNDALTCYQHYTVAREIARKLEQHPKLSADQAAGFELQAILARKVMASWSLRLDATAGPRTEAQISADVKRVGTPIIADANLALGGDAAAVQRSATRSAKCSALEAVAP